VTQDEGDDLDLRHGFPEFWYKTLKQEFDPPDFDALVEKIRAFRATIPPHVRIVAITKYTEVWTMRAAYAAGIRDFGENRIPDASAKKEILKDLTDVTWHLIGHLQSNKALKAIEIFDWIQSVDSLALAQRLDRLIQAQHASPDEGDPHIINSISSKKIIKTCLQVKLLPDLNKAGWTIPDLLADIPELLKLQAIHIQGLMVIPPLGLSHHETADYFQQANTLATQLAETGLDMTVRSMGMSDDYPIAIEQGSTLIRPGRILFSAAATTTPPPSPASP
jgi:PLP dependent protein